MDPNGAMMLADGSWAENIGGMGNPVYTGAVLTGMKRVNLDTMYTPVPKGINWLRDNRNSDSGWAMKKGEPSNTMASAWAVIGCVVLYYSGAPTLLVATFAAGLAAIVVFMGINLLWKISLHTAITAASVTVLIIVYGAVGALTAVLLPPVAWARIELEHHSPTQVATGALLAAVIVAFVFQLFGLR